MRINHNFMFGKISELQKPEIPADSPKQEGLGLTPDTDIDTEEPILTSSLGGTKSTSPAITKAKEEMLKKGYTEDMLSTYFDLIKRGDGKAQYVLKPQYTDVTRFVRKTDPQTGAVTEANFLFHCKDKSKISVDVKDGKITGTSQGFENSDNKKIKDNPAPSKNPNHLPSDPQPVPMPASGFARFFKTWRNPKSV